MHRQPRTSGPESPPQPATTPDRWRGCRSAPRRHPATRQGRPALGRPSWRHSSREQPARLLLRQPGGFDGVATLPLALHTNGLAVTDRPEVGGRLHLNRRFAASTAPSFAREHKHLIFPSVDELL